jgi:hypothetical protein
VVPNGADKNVLPDLTKKLREQTTTSDGNIVSQGKNFRWVNLESHPSIPWSCRLKAFVMSKENSCLLEVLVMLGLESTLQWKKIMENFWGS